MSASVSASEFLSRLTASGVLPSLDSSAVASLATRRDGAEVARALIDQGRLTTFQADELLADRGEKLMVGQYTILGRIGSGGMGTVFRAKHRLMNRIVALKVLAPAGPARQAHVDRFLREVEVVARLSHPNIVMAHDAGEVGGRLYLVMEFVDGRDLAAEVNHSGPLSVADAVECTLQAARGLARAHASGIVHRDIKPANLLRDASGTVKVADLGLARLSDNDEGDETTSLTHAGSVVGTPDYMAPEQALDSSGVDHRVDTYSLGCTLYYLLTGRPMFTGGSLMAILLKHREAEAPSLLDARSDVPAALAEIYRRMTAKRPGDRYAAMDEVVEALERLKAEEHLSRERPTRRHEGRAPNSNDETMAAVPGESDESIVALPVLSSLSNPTPSDVRRIRDLRVIVVEPSAFQRKVTVRFLQLTQIVDVRHAESAREALDIARTEGADVILAAMHLSDMTGLELLDSLHSDPSLRDLGFILASSDHDSVVSVSLDGSRAVALPKPFDLEQLKQALAQATGRVVEEMLN